MASRDSQVNIALSSVDQPLVGLSRVVLLSLAELGHMSLMRAGQLGSAAGNWLVVG